MNKTLEIRGHHLMCAVCARGGCEPPCGMEVLQPLLDAIWDDPYVMLKITADLDLNRAHYFDVYQQRGELKDNRAAPRSACLPDARDRTEQCPAGVLGLPHTL